MNRNERPRGLQSSPAIHFCGELPGLATIWSLIAA